MPFERGGSSGQHIRKDGHVIAHSSGRPFEICTRLRRPYGLGTFFVGILWNFTSKGVKK